MSPPIRLRLAPLLLLVLISAACEDDSKNGPTITGLDPARGPLRGGNRVRVTGVGFGEGATVRFGEHDAEVVTRGATQLEVVTPPAEVAGWVDVTVRAGSGGGATVLPAAYRYDGIPLRFVDVSARDLVGDAPLAGRLVTAADVDGDGDLDLVQGAGDGLRLYANKGDGRFDVWPGHRVAGVDAEYEAWVNQVLVEDFDGDGRPDLFLVTLGWAEERLLLNQGPSADASAFPGARFADATPMPEGPSHTIHAAAADLDGDGDLDVALVRLAFSDAELGVDAPAHVALWVNGGRGIFTEEGAARLPDAGLSAHGVAAGDVDGDGDVDLFLATDAGPCRLWLNDGHGVYREAPPDALPPHGDLRARLPAMGDLDGDGDLDLYVVSTAKDRLFVNDGHGRFTDQTAERLGAEDAVGYTATIADLDLDGVNDLVVSSYDGRLRLYRTDEVGRLYDYSGQIRPARPADADALSTAVGDFDGDGDPDLFVSRFNTRRPWLLRSWDPLPATDADGDGIPDVADTCPAEPDPDQANPDAYHFSCVDGPDCEARTGCRLAVWRGERAYLICAQAPLDYAAAQAYCRSRGADLVVLETAAEDAFVTAAAGETVWIGLDDRLTEGVFAWVDGTPLGYASWREGEPNDSGGSEDCAGIRILDGDAGGWNDFPCDWPFPFVCEDAVRRGAPDPGSACDNCPLAHNPDQTDTDGDGLGDACDGE